MSRRLSQEVKRLADLWDNNTRWPQRLLSVEINGLRGWSGQVARFNFPIVAIVGENGSGKSSIIQAAASLYQNGTDSRFASEFFPDTAWERSSRVEIKGEYRQGERSDIVKVRKPTTRWRGNRERPQRPVVYLDLSRLQPVAARVGYQRIVAQGQLEVRSNHFDISQVRRLSTILGRQYENARTAFSDVDDLRDVPVLSFGGNAYSGFHQGAGEITVAELLKTQFPNNCLLLIDEIETSLHPRSQRRLVRDLAEVARTQNIQIIITTHSPYVLEELPERARLQILKTENGREILIGVSPEFAMTKMDDEAHAAVDIFVEDRMALLLIQEIIAFEEAHVLSEVDILTCGPASIGKSLGQMISAQRLRRPSLVFLDGDQDPSPGCNILPGNTAPEIFIFSALQNGNYFDVPERLGRQYADVQQATVNAMTMPQHHEWLNYMSNQLRIPADVIWVAMVGSWVQRASTEQQRRSVVQPILDTLNR